MSDPDYDAALAEAYSSAPTSDDDIVVHTLEIRHPAFVDDAGQPTSLWMVRDHQDFVARIEPGAPVKGGQQVTFAAIAFDFQLAPVETSPVPEIAITIDNVGRDIIDQLDAAVIDGRIITVCYRPYLAGDRSGPKIARPPVYTLVDVEPGNFRIDARARTGADLSVAFPRETYKAEKFPGLVGL